MSMTKRAMIKQLGELGKTAGKVSEGLREMYAEVEEFIESKSERWLEGEKGCEYEALREVLERAADEIESLLDEAADQAEMT